MFNFCALCNTTIDSSNDSREHIIPNSIGGRLKIKSFICRDCNSQTGENWDSEIWRQFSTFAMLHGIERDRGVPPNIKIQTVDGGCYLLLPDGSMTIDRPSYSAEPSAEGIKINITARDESEARRMAKQVAKKHPKLDIGAFLSAMTVKDSPLESPVTFTSQFGGAQAGRSMIKSAVALVTAAGTSSQACDAAIAYLKDVEVTPPYAFFYVRDLVSKRPETHAINCVSVVGDPVRRRLIGYVEYFSMSRIVVILSNSYDGEHLQATYAFNPADGEPVDVHVDLRLSEDELELVRTNQAAPDISYSTALNSGFGIIYKRSQSRRIGRETQKAFEHACTALGIPYNSTVPPEYAQEFSALIAQYLSPVLAEMIRR